MRGTRRVAFIFVLLSVVLLGRTTAEEPAAEPPKTPDVVYVPTPHDVVDKMLELAGVTKSDVLYDLGCGDGRIMVMAAKKVGCRAAGFELDPRRVADSKANIKKNGVGELVSVENKDIFTLDLRPASVVTLYLLPDLNVKLIPQLQQLKPGARIVSHDFPMGDIEPEKTVEMRSKEDQVMHTLYLWTAPLKRELKKRTPPAGAK
jgi:SAM-dependent methyltransferase